MPLTEAQRQQLDGIVSQMEANHEPEDNIRFVVGDFKAKYDQPSSQAADWGPLNAAKTIGGTVAKDVFVAPFRSERIWLGMPGSKVKRPKRLRLKADPAHF